MIRTLVDVETLRREINNPDWLVIDVRHQLADPAAGEKAFVEAHLPGAVFMHLDRDLSGPVNGKNGRHPLPDPALLAEQFARLGVSGRTQVVVYDDASGMIAGRLWWLLRWLGHPAVALLDGGLQAWLAAGQPLSRERVVRNRQRFLPNIDSAMVVEADQVLAKLGHPSFMLLDARSPDRFRGENETLDPVGGHIPGAINRFLKDNLQADGKLKPVTELRSDYAVLLNGMPPDRVVHQCGSGVSACLNMLAMEHAGLHGSRLYAGSWSEWCSDPSRPMVLRTA